MTVDDSDFGSGDFNIDDAINQWSPVIYSLVCKSHVIDTIKINILHLIDSKLDQ